MEEKVPEFAIENEQQQRQREGKCLKSGDVPKYLVIPPATRTATVTATATDRRELLSSPNLTFRSPQLNDVGTTYKTQPKHHSMEARSASAHGHLPTLIALLAAPRNWGTTRRLRYFFAKVRQSSGQHLRTPILARRL